MKKQKIDSIVFTPEYLAKLKKLPPLPREVEDKMRVFVNLLIDRILEDHKKGKV